MTIQIINNPPLAADWTRLSADAQHMEHIANDSAPATLLSPGGESHPNMAQIVALANQLLSALANNTTQLFNTKALANTGLAGLTNNQFAVVIADESVAGSPRTIYQKVSGAYVFVANLDLLRSDLANTTTGASHVGYFGGTAADRLDSPPATDRQPIIAKDITEPRAGTDATQKAGSSAGRTSYQIDLPVHIGTRRNLWQYTEDVTNASYSKFGVTVDSDSIVFNGITLRHISTASFYAELYSPIGGLGLTPFVVGQRYMLSYYAMSKFEGEQFIQMRVLGSSSSYGHGYKILTNRPRRIWLVAQATSTSALTVITTPTTALGGEAGSASLCWLFQGDAAGGTVEAYVGGFMIEKLPDPTYKDGIAMIGDSTMAGGSAFVDWGQSFEVSRWLEGLLNVNVFNRAIGGNTTAMMTARWTTDISPLAVNCKYVIIQGGINDIGGGVSLTTIQANFTAMYNQALTDGLIPVFFTCTPGAGIVAASGGETERLALNTWLKQTFPNVIDIASVISDPHVASQIRNYSTWYGDGVHYVIPAKRAIGIYAASWPGWDFVQPSQYQPVLAASWSPTATLFNNGIQVLGQRATGWTAPTGTPNKGAFAADTATATQAAQRLLAIEQALITHGIIGP